MSRQKFAAAVAVTVAALGSAAPVLAELEPKNELRFTRPVVTSAPLPDPRSEPKNELPFTRPVVPSAPLWDPRSEPKNEPPFVRPPVVLVVASDAFDWTDAGIGAAAGIGVALAFVGGAVLVRTHRSVEALQ